MTIQTTSKILLDPVTEADIIEQYEKDEGWRKVGTCTFAVMFENKSPQFVIDAQYISSKGVIGK